MLPKQLIIGASAVAAVASASQMPLFRGSGEYPRLSGFSYYDNREKHVKCSFYNDQGLTERYLALNFYVKDDSMRTESIYRPKTTNREAFNIHYSERGVISNYQQNYPHPGQPYIDFDKNTPPRSTGEDPLMNLTLASNDEMDKLLSAIDKIRFTRNRPMIFVGELYDAEKEQNKDRIYAIKAINSVCAAAVQSIKKQYDAGELCDKSDKIADTAVTAARDEGWVAYEDKLIITHMRPRVPQRATARD
ncbi:hypothetical protein FOZ63_008101 [Perkinsus olseni]|uniref:Uncharacterized protein n=1 Tax=Perkinsus olseni TaxID=32597 RepID=A0A7J6UHP6_PEROL|nr:hypothetical protein FOZ63_008101 [Perkinsus olseni]KAF4756538.1 hypothetical protein FOZ62_000215 [Perkinsus olseni]